MKKNRCFKLTVLLLTMAMLFGMAVSTAFAEENVSSSGVNIQPIISRKLDANFVQSATILDAKGKPAGNFTVATNPNAAYTLKLEVREPVHSEEEEATEITLPKDTKKVRLYYQLENMRAKNGSNEDVSWTFDEQTSQLVFHWKNDDKDWKESFSAEISVSPAFPAENDISGTYVLVSGTEATLGTTAYKEGNRGKLKSYVTKMSGDKVAPMAPENPTWTLTHVSGNYYTIQSANNGQYLHIQKKGANGYADNSLYLETTDEATAQKFEAISLGGYYAFTYDGNALNNSGNNAYNGFASYGYANGGNNEKFKLYPVSSVQQDPTYSLSGTWVIQSVNRILSNTSKATGKLYAIGYNTAADNDSILIANDNVKTWTFTNVVRDWYTISSEGKYLNIKNGSVSVSDQSQNLLIRSDDNFATIIISNGEFDNKGNTYCLRNIKDNDNFESVSIGTGVNTDASKAMTLISEEMIATHSEVISGNWAIITEISGAAMLDNLNNNKLTSVPYYKTENGVFNIETEIPAWTFTQVDGGWYTIQTQDGKYLSINDKVLTLSDSVAKVFVQEYNGKIRITSGKQFALNNSQGNPANGYAINDQGKAKDANEWHTLSRIDQEAGQMNLVIFDRNGGTTVSAPNAIMGYAGDKITLPDMEASQNGHAFMGWAEVKEFLAKDSKSGERYHDLYKPGMTYTISPEKHTTLYAVYNTEEKAKIQFGIRLDGVIQDEPNTYDKGAYKGHFWEEGILKESRWAIDIDSTKPVNNYYIENDVTACLNWVPSIEKITEYLKSDGNITFDPETQYIHYYVLKKTPGGDWHVDGVIRNKASIEVSYNANVPVNEKKEISNMPGSYQVAPGTEIIIGTPKNSTSVMTPVREGYVFTGWNTSPDGSGTSYPASSYIRLKSNLNLYAQWADAEGELTLTLESSLPNGQPAPEGTMVTLTAKATGFDNLVEGVDYILQWQYSTDLKNWIDVPGANDITYTFELNITTATYTWRVVAKDIK